MYLGRDKIDAGRDEMIWDAGHTNPGRHGEHLWGTHLQHPKINKSGRTLTVATHQPISTTPFGMSYSSL